MRRVAATVAMALLARGVGAEVTQGRRAPPPVDETRHDPHVSPWTSPVRFNEDDDRTDPNAVAKRAWSRQMGGCSRKSTGCGLVATFR